MSANPECKMPQQLGLKNIHMLPATLAWSMTVAEVSFDSFV